MSDVLVGYEFVHAASRYDARVERCPSRAALPRQPPVKIGRVGEHMDEIAGTAKVLGAQ